MGATLYCTQSEENRRVKTAKTGLFLIYNSELTHKCTYIENLCHP